MRRVAFGAAAPAVGGVLITSGIVTGHPVTTSSGRWVLVSLCLVPVVLIHFGSRATLDGLPWYGAAASVAVGGLAAYAVSVVGLTLGAAAALAVVVAAQAGILQAAAQIASIVSVTLALRARQRRAG